jgi:hypothetical protein
MMGQADVYSTDITFCQQRWNIAKDLRSTSLLCTLPGILRNHITDSGDACILDFAIAIQVRFRNPSTANESDFDGHAILPFLKVYKQKTSFSSKFSS